MTHGCRGPWGLKTGGNDPDAGGKLALATFSNACLADPILRIRRLLYTQNIECVTSKHAINISLVPKVKVSQNCISHAY
jgi:hypothetical protein